LRGISIPHSRAGPPWNVPTDRFVKAEKEIRKNAHDVKGKIRMLDKSDRVSSKTCLLDAFYNQPYRIDDTMLPYQANPNKRERKGIGKGKASRLRQL
jgi:hypothetical protein